MLHIYIYIHTYIYIYIDLCIHTYIGCLTDLVRSAADLQGHQLALQDMIHNL